MEFLQKNKIYLLSLLLIGIYLIGINYFTQPRWIGTLYDPSYPYLFNGIDWLRGIDVFQWNHPGAFVHWMHFIILKIYLLFNRAINMSDLATESESLLLLIGYVNILLYLSILIFSILKLKKYINENYSLLLFISFLASINLNEIISNTPETYLVLIAPLFVIELLIIMKDENIVTQFDYFILGVLAAVLFSTKYTSFFLISCIAFVVKPKYWIIIFTGFILTISILFIPIYSNVIESFKWLIGVILQPGFGYGIESEDVNKGFNYFAQFLLKSLLFDKLWLIMFVFTLFIYFFDRETIWTKIQKGKISGLFIILVISILIMTYKEMFRYFIPSKYILVLIIFLIIDASDKYKKCTIKQISNVSTIFIFFIMSYLSFSQYNQIKRFKELELFSLKVEEIVSDPNIATIRMFTSSSLKFATFFGSYYSNGNYIQTKNDYYLMFFSDNYYQSFNEWNLLNNKKDSIELSEIFKLKYKKIYLIGRISAKNTPYWNDNKIVTFKEVLAKDGEYLYELTLK